MFDLGAGPAAKNQTYATSAAVNPIDQIVEFIVKNRMFDDKAKPTRWLDFCNFHGLRAVVAEQDPLLT